MTESTIFAASPLVAFKLFVLVVLYLFVPLSALTYYFSRRKRRVIEVDRILTVLNIDPQYRRAYEPDGLNSYIWGVVYLSIVSAIGLVLLLLSREIGLANGEFPAVAIREVQFPQEGSRLVFAMAFLGVYLSVLQHLFRRYATTDLPPTMYYGASIRIVLASVVALVIYNAFSALSGGGDSDAGITSTIWPALAFVIGVFPQRGLRWLTDRIPILSPQGDSLVRPAPLEMIEGVESHDVLRLEELGIDTCYDLASVDFVPLLLKTPYSARQLIDWILQAKLCAYFGDATKDLRRMGIRTIADLETLTALEMEALPAETSVTAPVLLRAHAAVKTNPEIQRLREVGQVLGVFWNQEKSSMSPTESTPQL